ncbi:MAG: polya polymerase [Candidatus Cloacimonetes bacterium HGW-Cloacimonetes-3]|jgi:poly(A) polymerase|nr:MAG: polya polymerase [Candidatus Cloacimonetes bacterium HGW-Cloacimonetes-3]
MNLDDIRYQLAGLIQNTAFDGRAYFAGGCVRDYVMRQTSGSTTQDKSIQDIDITVEMENGGVLLAEYLLPHLQATDCQTYPEFGTAKLSFSDGYMEFVATRKEHYRRNSRYPSVSAGTLVDDVLRRDFTINTLLMDIKTGELLDLTGMGFGDLNSGIIRCVGEPVKKFREDPLRLLRALRFALRFGFEIEEGTYTAMQSEANALDRLSQTCIKQELSKIAVNTPSRDLLAALRILNWNSQKLYSLINPN